MGQQLGGTMPRYDKDGNIIWHMMYKSENWIAAHLSQIFMVLVIVTPLCCALWYVIQSQNEVSAKMETLKRANLRGNTFNQQVELDNVEGELRKRHGGRETM